MMISIGFNRRSVAAAADAGGAGMAAVANTETLPYRGTFAGGGYSTVKTAHGLPTRCYGTNCYVPTPLSS
jgi:hypothetical protein